MQIQELKVKLTTEIDPSATWLENQFPTIPEKRCSELTYLNYQNVEDCFGIEARKKLETAVKKNPEIKVVIVAVLTKAGKVKGPRAFIENEALYYGQYELFNTSAGMDGFVEIFHNIKKT